MSEARNPIEALIAVRGAAVSALTLGAPLVDFIGFDGAGATYECRCSDATGANGVLRVEWETVEQTDTDSDVGSLGGCGSTWRVTGTVSVRRCMPAFEVSNGTTDGSPQNVVKRQAASTAMGLEMFAVARAIADLGRPDPMASADQQMVKVLTAMPWGPSGNCAGYDIRWYMLIEECD